VDGETLNHIFGDVLNEKMFLSLSLICCSVLACRVSPEQKSLLVRLVKKGLRRGPVTLAIGDGANDVAMIQEAQVGVGINGKEGRQAANAADFSIAQFRFLRRLLLVHGRLDYRRISKVVLFSFYKNIVLSLVVFFFTFFSGYSGQTLFDDYIHSLYNIVLAWPVIAFGVFDRDISEETLLRHSFLYFTSRRHLDLNPKTILFEISQALVDAISIFFISYACYLSPKDVWSKDGYTEGLWLFGTAVYSSLVAAMFLRCAMLTCTWTYLAHIAFWGSAVAYLLFLIALQVDIPIYLYICF
jgi:magnesium-transporting ATPase (P-type)